MASLRTRAISLLRSSLRFSHEAEWDEGSTEKEPALTSSSNVEPLMSEKLPLEEQASAAEQSLSLSSAEKTGKSPADVVVIGDLESQRLVRVIPTWAHTLDENPAESDPLSNELPFIPPRAQVASHNGSPSSKQKFKADPPRGRLFDFQRESITPTPRAPFSEDAPRWRDFARSSAYPPEPGEAGEIVTEDWLVQNGGDYSRAWLASSETGDADSDVAHLFKFRQQRKVWWKRAQRTILHSPVIPLIIRTIVWLFSLVALALGASIHKISYDSKARNLVNGPSPNMAIIVDAIALIYIFYITYDEYTGKPLGLRSAKGKMRLIFLDLVFIVFDSANLSLAFAAVTDSYASCDDGVLQANICRRQKALASVLLIALIAWLLTFSISVTRLIERVAAK